LRDVRPRLVQRPHLKEIVEFASGKDVDLHLGDGQGLRERFDSRAAGDPGQARASSVPEEIHRLASKTRKTLHADQEKASCHSDFVDPEQAREIQRDAIEAGKTKDE
jgi:phosphomethylpyrimidine synthase